MFAVILQFTLLLLCLQNTMFCFYHALLYLAAIHHVCLYHALLRQQTYVKKIRAQEQCIIPFL